MVGHEMSMMPTTTITEIVLHDNCSTVVGGDMPLYLGQMKYAVLILLSWSISVQIYFALTQAEYLSPKARACCLQKKSLKILFCLYIHSKPLIDRYIHNCPAVVGGDMPMQL